MRDRIDERLKQLTDTIDQLNNNIIAKKGQAFSLKEDKDEKEKIWLELQQDNDYSSISPDAKESDQEFYNTTQEELDKKIAKLNQEIKTLEAEQEAKSKEFDQLKRDPRAQELANLENPKAPSSDARAETLKQTSLSKTNIEDLYNILLHNNENKAPYSAIKTMGHYIETSKRTFESLSRTDSETIKEKFCELYNKYATLLATFEKELHNRLNMLEGTQKETFAKLIPSYLNRFKEESYHQISKLNHLLHKKFSKEFEEARALFDKSKEEANKWLNNYLKYQSEIWLEIKSNEPDHKKRLNEIREHRLLLRSAVLSSPTSNPNYPYTGEARDLKEKLEENINKIRDEFLEKHNSATSNKFFSHLCRLNESFLSNKTELNYRKTFDRVKKLESFINELYPENEELRKTAMQAVRKDLFAQLKQKELPALKDLNSLMHISQPKTSDSEVKKTLKNEVVKEIVKKAGLGEKYKDKLLSNESFNEFFDTCPIDKLTSDDFVKDLVSVVKKESHFSLRFWNFSNTISSNKIAKLVDIIGQIDGGKYEALTQHAKEHSISLSHQSSTTKKGTSLGR
jgi:hypothetical protein